jgi:hypothetical protein
MIKLFRTLKDIDRFIRECSICLKTDTITSVLLLKYHRARGVTSVSHGEAFQYIVSDSEHIDCIHVCMSG